MVDSASETSALKGFGGSSGCCVVQAVDRLVMTTAAKSVRIRLLAVSTGLEANTGDKRSVVMGLDPSGRVVWFTSLIC
ncbi:hypothetical protein J057_11296 [Marinobacter nanhaiticus D15-8W]|uniref:Uncharacterized protein n=1 Tax=Marinobacter nanhaiticus D15-8W TaxID=626887 RepID=N6W6P0_9GAMM|nr:hypothetical protein J057_11296 [Marinobacter nanhaiticus D15-8W]